MCHTQDEVDYHAIIQPCITTWQDECIAKLATEDIVTIADMLLLSYEVVQASVIMAQARLVIQSELLNIVTLSINDTFDARMQAQNNDLTEIKNAVSAIEQAQEKIKFACKSLKSFGPLLVKIDPTSIQLFISNLKNVILTWAKTQKNIVTSLENIKQELINNIDIFSDAHEVFNAVISADQIEHSQLLEGVNGLSAMYNNTENIIGNLTIIRQEGITSFSNLLTLYFKYHYQILYNHIQNNDYAQYNLITIEDHQLPSPEQIFALA